MSVVYFVVQLTVFVASVWYIYVTKELTKPAELFIPIATGWAFTKLSDKVTVAWNYLSLVPRLVHLAVTGKPLRISFAALISIPVDNKYLLVKSKRFPQYQPPGGVYRFFDRELKQRFKLKDDPGIKKQSGGELRLAFEPGSVWRVFDFLGWFRSRCGRESGPQREFAEELINPGILKSTEFGDVAFEYVTTASPKISFSEHFQMFELMRFEIFRIILNDQQTHTLKALAANPPDEVCFLTADEITRQGNREDKPVKIGTQTRYIVL